MKIVQRLLYLLGWVVIFLLSPMWPFIWILSGKGPMDALNILINITDIQKL